MPDLELERSEWWQIVETVRDRGERTPVYTAMTHDYNVCIASLLTEEAGNALMLYDRLSGTKNETFASLQKLPCHWISACMVIESERADIARYVASRKYGN